MQYQSARTARLEARIAPDALLLVKRAAEMQGRSVSDFVVAAAQDAASRMIEQAHIIQLSMKDQQNFADAILSPATPNAALQRAANAYKALVIHSK